MAIYLGFYRAVPNFLQETRAKARAGDTAPDATFRRLVTALPEQLPRNCTLLGSYATIGGAGLGTPGPPSVLILETSDSAALAFVSQYYSGYLEIQWAPAQAVGMTSAERAAYLEAALAAIPDVEL